MRAVVTGMIGTYPVGGVVWDYGQYLLGLEHLGWDVYYLEDTGQWGYDLARDEMVGDGSYAAAFLDRELALLSPTLSRRWHFRSGDGTLHGMSADELDDVLADADLFLNVSGSCVLRERYVHSRNKVLIDTDPGTNHFEVFPRAHRRRQTGKHGFGYSHHDHFFTYATLIGDPLCPLPMLDMPWRTTRPPVVIDEWDSSGTGTAWTTVLTWDPYRRRRIHNGDESYGGKAEEFWRISHLPTLVDAEFEVALGGISPPVRRLEQRGWRVLPSTRVSSSSRDYRSYIEASRGEFSVAKNVYVATYSGWFSCRSVCYLAAGLPVVVQDTGFSSWLPVGEGLHVFTNVEEAAAAIKAVEADYDAQRAAALRVAEEHFAAEVVIGDLLSDVLD